MPSYDYEVVVKSWDRSKSGFCGSGRVWVEQGRAGLCEFGDASFGSVGSYNKRVVDKEDFPPGLLPFKKLIAFKRSAFKIVRLLSAFNVQTLTALKRSK